MNPGNFKSRVTLLERSEPVRDEMRYWALDDLPVTRCAIPAYQTAYGHKAPTYKELTQGRKKGDAFADLTHEELLALASE